MSCGLWVVRTIFIATFVQISKLETNIGSISCAITFGDFDHFNCSVGCRGICSENCIDIFKTVFGSVSYHKHSSVCRSAIHDRRLSLWNNSQEITFIKFTANKRVEFQPSFRQRIQSSGYTPSNTYYVFTSPRISETLLDVISLHRNYLSNGSEAHEQECRILTDYKQSVYFANDQFERRDSSPKYLGNNPSYTKYSCIWSYKRTKTGFRCLTNFNSLSDIFSIATPTSALFNSNRFTVTANRGDNTSLQHLLNFKNADQKEIGGKLTKDGFAVLKSHYNDIKPIEIADTGLYKVMKDRKTLALARLIVRVCEAGKYGPQCAYDCPDCLNGGICHDITGECICPPGFNGTTCEKTCPPHYFGKHCNQKCYNKFGRVMPCSEVLFCLPDPYGCSCASGYVPPLCKQICGDKKYGVNCMQSCSPNCEESCNPFDGHCSKCKSGWHGNKCEISYPVLKSNVSITNITSSSLVIHFQKWSKGEDEGEGTPSYYLIGFLNTANNTWSQVTERHIENETVSYSVKIENLDANTEYLFQIFIRDKTGKAQFEGVPAIRVTTLCSTPLSPVNITLKNKGPRNVSVTWDNPHSRGQCNGSIVIEYQNANTSEIFNVTIPKYTKNYTFSTKPYTTWNVRMSYRGKNGIRSNWSNWGSFISEQDAPSQVRSLQIEKSFINNQSSQLFLLKWEKPEEENGIITSYIIGYSQVRWLHDCNASLESFPKFNVSSATYSVDVDLRVSAIYKIQVSAFTVKEGPPLEIETETDQDVPYSIPINLKVINKNKRKISIEWAPPDCSLSNGKITSYELMITSNDRWDSTNHTFDTNRTEFTFENLTPYTSYDIKIFASNNVGVSNKYANITLSTKSGRPPAPFDLTISHKTMQSFSLIWKPPYPPNGMLEKYRITYENNYNGKIQEVDSNNASCYNDEEYHCYTINNLEAKKIYFINIKAKNIGIDDFGDPSHITDETEESVPDPPKQAYLKRSSEYSLDLTWDLPTRQNGDLRCYRINATAIKSFNEEIYGTTRFSVVNASERSYVFEDLYPATLYNISIEASTSAGYGEPLTIQFTTKHSVPVIEVEPKVLQVTESTITLSIKPIKFDKGPISEYHVIVERKLGLEKREIKIQAKELIDYNSSRALDLNYYSAARFFPNETNSEGFNFTIGDGKIYNYHYNAPLITGENYQLAIAVSSYYNQEKLVGYKYLSDVIKVERRTSKTTDKSSLIGVLFGVIAVLIIIIALIGYSKKRDLIGKFRRENGFNVKFLNKKTDDDSIISSTNSALDEKSDNGTNVKKIAKTAGIAAANLDEYIINATESGELKRQFMSIKKGQCKPWTFSKLPVNKMKNRYGNLLAYDDTRVTLQICDDDPYSDYINANYVDGYRRPKKYIATQGPKQATINDFWRMISQDNVYKIVMVTNLVENEKTKCEKYWPETTEKYGNVKVSLKDREMYLDYVIRTFLITEGERTRTLKHFHYITWPDHGVPRFTNSVVSFSQKIRNFKPNTNSPVVVHCSAGVGRTGTLILLDSMLDMAYSENRIDLASHLTVMRQQRINIVETYEQYHFVYQALADSLCEFKTSILCSDYNKEVGKLSRMDPTTGKTGFHIQYERLEKLRPRIKLTDCRSGYETDNQTKNRDLDVVPHEKARVILIGCAPESSYINAVYIDGYKQKDSFIVTQVPLPNTISDFWRMILYADTNTFILLNELHKVCPAYWPNSNDTISYKNIEVSNILVETFDSIIIRTFNLKDLTKKGQSKTIKQFHLSNWPSNSCIPYSSESILQLTDKVERWQQQTGTSITVVQCLDGVRACGIYCTSVFVCDKIKTEQEVDVFQAVRCIRENRPQFIENLEQFIICYRIATSYLDSFQIYANFQ